MSIAAIMSMVSMSFTFVKQNINTHTQIHIHTHKLKISIQGSYRSKQQRVILILFCFAACKCYYNGFVHEYGDTIYDTHDGNGTCITAYCGENGEIVRILQTCSTTMVPTTAATFSFTTGNKSLIIQSIGVV